MNRITNRDLQPPVFTPIQPEPALPDVVRYLRVLNRYKWGILMVVIAVGMLAACPLAPRSGFSALRRERQRRAVQKKFGATEPGIRALR